LSLRFAQRQGGDFDLWRGRNTVHKLTQCVLLSALFLLWTINAFPQSEEVSGKQGNLYSIALAASMDQMGKSWGRIDDGDHGSRMRTDYRRMLVKKDPEITNDLPSQFGDHQVEFLDEQELIGRYKTLHKEFPVLVMGSLHNSGPRLKIQVSVYWVGLRKNRLILGFSDWSVVEFQYDCQKQAYTISDIKLGGI